MRLFEIRLSDGDLKNLAQTGAELRHVFVPEEDMQIKFVFNDKNNESLFRLGDSTEVAKEISSSIENSCRKRRGYGEIFAISSLNTCRFLIFEDDGLVRVCLTHDDSISIFDKIRSDVRDISTQLIETDLYDHL